MKFRILNSFVLLVAILASACSSAQTEDRAKSAPQTKQEQLIEQNRDRLKVERERIESFIEENNFEMIRTGSGLYYMVLAESKENPARDIQEGDVIEYEYRISLLDGTPIRNSKDDGLRQIMVGKDQVEIGLHEAFLLSQITSEMLFIIPSHLAHGLAGNTDNVPPGSTLIYEIEPLIKLN